MTIIFVNKNPDYDYQTAITFTNFVPAGTANVYQVSAADLTAVRHEPDITDASTNFTFTFPAYSATLIRFTVADSDNDGIPDIWMIQNFGHPTGTAADNSRRDDDADGDGFTNYQEYLSGTVPTLSTSAFRIKATSADTNNNFLLTFDTVAGKTYAVETNASLSVSNGWHTFTNNLLGTGGTITVSDPGALLQTNRFYRIRLQTP
jgi:hypothetical protein